MTCAAFQRLADAILGQLLSARLSAMADLFTQSTARLREPLREGSPIAQEGSLFLLSPRVVPHSFHVVSPLFSCIVLRAEKLGAKWAQTPTAPTNFVVAS